mgnify:CR=1 FL=1
MAAAPRHAMAAVVAAYCGGGGHGIDVGSAGGSEAASRSSSSMIQRIGVR